MKNARILLVDDDALATTVLGGWLQHLGTLVVEVQGIADADQALAAGTFDLVLSDIHMPGNHGLEWVEQHLAREDCPPFVLLTGSPELETAMRAANLPVAGYLIKPPNFTALAALLQRLLNDRRRRAILRALAGEVAALLDDPAWSADPGDHPLRGRLRQLTDCLSQEATRPAREAAPLVEVGAPWREAIRQTIVVLEKTKGSFRSKELGQLRQRLNHMLAGEHAA